MNHEENKVQLIKEEILRRKQSWQHSDKQYEHGGKDVCDYLLGFIDSLPEEPKCIYNRTLDERKKFCKYCSAACDVRIEEEPKTENLIEEIDKIWKTCNPIDEGMGVEMANIHIEQFDDIARHFVEWQKQQMMKDAVEGKVQCGYGDGNKLSIKAMLPQDSDLKYADKVKVLILKTE